MGVRRATAPRTCGRGADHHVMKGDVDPVCVSEAKDLPQGPRGHFVEGIQFFRRRHLKEPVGSVRWNRIVPPEQSEFVLLSLCELLILIEEDVGSAFAKQRLPVLQGEKL